MGSLQRVTRRAAKTLDPQRPIFRTPVSLNLLCTSLRNISISDSFAFLGVLAVVINGLRLGLVAVMQIEYSCSISKAKRSKAEEIDAFGTSSL
jgi:hypothetical protein